MQAILDIIVQQPLYGVIASLLVVLLIVTLFKKLIVVALVVTACLAAYSAYLHSEGSALAERMAEVRQDAREVGHELREDVGKELRHLHDESNPAPPSADN